MKNNKLEESDVEERLRTYLIDKGWSLTNLPKSVGIHGCDVIA